MTDRHDEAEPSLPDPHMTIQLAAERRLQQEATRGPWASPRDTPHPEPPWPSPDNPILWYLVDKARASIDAGTPVTEVLLHLATQAWFEGGVENYDRGQWDGRVADWPE